MLQSAQSAGMLKPSSKSLQLIRCSTAANGVFSFHAANCLSNLGILCTVCWAERKDRVVGPCGAGARAREKVNQSWGACGCEGLLEDSRVVHTPGKKLAGEGARATWAVLSPSL